MNKPKDKKKSDRAPSPFDFCTKHTGSFYATCGCLNKKKDKKVEEEPIAEMLPLEDNNQE